MTEQLSKAAHSLILDNKSKLSLTGVTDVVGFDEQTVSLTTDCGPLIVKGNSLHISKLNLDTKDVCIDGIINSLQYFAKSDKNLKSKLFK
ncbi:MAG: sporulation protein YabP [Ruminococcus sp.]|nr:sporulation protein YabP [Ruminococcus sp.]